MPSARSKRARHLALGAILALGCELACADVPRTLRFEALSVEHGLPQESINTLLQDRHGFLWIGTQAGLARYDGYQVRGYHADPGRVATLVDNYVTALVEDRHGRLWVGSRGGLQRFRPERGDFETTRPALPDARRAGTRQVQALLVGADDLLWMGSAEGLHRYDPVRGEFASWYHDPGTPESLPHNVVSALARDPGGGLWVGTAAGLAHMPISGSDVQRFRLDDESRPDRLHNAVRALLIDTSGRLWVGTAAGLEIWTLGEGEPRRRRLGDAEGLPPAELQTLHLDRDGRVWAGTRTAGLLRWQEETQRFLTYRHQFADRHSLADDNVQALLQDGTGTLWVGTRTGGASRVDLASGGFERHAVFGQGDDLRSARKIYGIAEAGDGTLWLGSVGGGLHRFDRHNGELRTYRHLSDDAGSLPDDTVMGVHLDARGRHWVGTYRGLAHFDPVSGRFSEQWRDPADPVMERVRLITSDAAGVLWVGTEGGLLRHDPERGESRVFRHDPADPRSLGFGRVFAVLPDRRGRLWVGTESGLDRLAADGTGFEHWRPDPARADALSNGRISDLYEDRRGRLWVGTGSGLNRVDDPGATELRFHRYAGSAGLGIEPIGAILEAKDGALWVSSDRGVTRLDPDRGEVRNYTARDGLIDASYYISSGLALDDGSLLFGGAGGLTEFRPERIRANATAPAVVISDVQLFNQRLDPAALPAGVALRFPVHQATQLSLAHGHSVFSLEFAALHFADPARNRYAYRLVGLDPDWIEADATQRSVTYSSLAPGDYVFEVRAANKDGVWSDAPTTLAITVAPPWWGTWWARAIAAACAALGLWAAFRLRLRGLTEQRARLQAKVAEAVSETRRQKEAIEQAHQNLNVLGEIGRELTATLDQAAVLAILDRHVHTLVDATAFGIYRLDASSQMLESVLCVEDGRPLPEDRIALDDPRRYAARCARERAELLIELAPGDVDPSHRPGTLRILSYLFAPLAVGERLVGVMTVQSARQQAYGERHRQVFRTLCAYAAIALDNASAYRRLAEADAEAERLLRERQTWLEQEVGARTLEIQQQKADIEQAHSTLAVLGDIGRDITAQLVEDAVCQTLDRHVHDLLDATTFVIYLLDRDGQTLTSVLRVEEGKTLAQARIELASPTRHAAQCARERRELLFDMDPAHENPSQVPGTLRILTSLFAPLLIGERLLGVMSIQSPHRHAYGERDRLVFRTLSAYGAIALDNAAAYRRVTEADAEVQRVLRERQSWLEQEVRTRTNQLVTHKERIEQAHRDLSVLGEMGRQITATLDEAAVFQTLHRHVHGLFDASGFGIYLLDVEGEALQQALFIECGQPTPHERIALADPVRYAALCARERRELLIETEPGTADPSHVPGTLRTLSSLFAPLHSGDRLLGVMTIQSPRPHAYGERERVLFRSLCAYGAIALDNAAAYRRLAEAEANVQRMLQEQQLIFDNVAAAVFFVKDRIVHRCNRGMEEMLGYGPGELIGQPTRIYHADDASWEALGRAVYPLVTAGHVAEGEWEIVRKDGRPIWIAYRGRALDPGDEALGSIWVAQDISDRKRTEAELERIRREQQIIFDNSPGGGVLLTRNRVIVSCNPGLEALLGYEPGALNGQPARINFASDEVYEAFGRWAYPILAAGGTAKGEVEYCDRQGQPILAYVSGKAIDPDDLSQGVVWMAQDIRQQKKDAAELDQARRELQIIFENNIGAVAIVREGRIERCSRGFLTMHGYTEEEAIGMPVEAFAASQEASAELDRRVEEEMRAGKVVSGEYEYRRKDGSTGWLLYQGRALDPADLDSGRIWLCQDISKLKGQEAALLASKAQVEQSLQEVEQLNRQVTLLGELTGFLQACPSAEEAFSCIGDFGPRLFPDSEGALYLAEEHGNTWIEQGHWGQAAWRDAMPHSLSSEECWALRRSRAYRVDAPTGVPCCPHVAQHGAERPPYVCLPLTAQGKTFGLLHIEHRQHQEDGEADRRYGLAVAMAEQIALAIANVQLREALLQQSIRDPLTGLYNRRYLQESLFREMAHGKRHQTRLAVLMIDVDHFKKFNDTFGHRAGDVVLQNVARTLAACFRRSDITCRYGGEEFTVLLPGTDLELAQRLANDLLDGIRALALSHENRPLDRITASLGIAVFPDHGNTPQSLLEAADAALYQAKLGGRNRVVACAAASG